MKFQESAQAQPRVIVNSSDVGTIQADFYERAAGVSHVSVSPVALAREGRAEDTRAALQSITKSATEIVQDVPSRNINAQLNAIQAHLEVMRVNEHGKPFHIVSNSPMEKMLCDELQATMSGVYECQKSQGVLGVQTLLGTIAGSGTYSDRKEYTSNASHAVDDVFTMIVRRMSDAERQELTSAVQRFVPEFQAYVKDLLDQAASPFLAQKNKLVASEPEALTL